MSEDPSVDIETRPGGVVVSHDERLPDVIRSLNLGPIIWKLSSEGSEVPESERLSEAQALRLSEEYRRFLTLAVEGDGRTTTPSRTIDQFWHQHILDTKKYYEDMKAVFGHMMHPEPERESSFLRLCAPMCPEPKREASNKNLCLDIF